MAQAAAFVLVALLLLGDLFFDSDSDNGILHFLRRAAVGIAVIVLLMLAIEVGSR